MAAAAESPQVPVTIITGCLGSGKTTLLNHILEYNRRQPSRLKLVVIENEFAMEFGVEKQLLLLPSGCTDAEELHEVFEFGTGCLCCSSFGQFIATLKRIAAASPVDQVIVETTGLAGGGPDGTGWAPVFQQPDLSQHFYLQDVVTVVDCHHFTDDLHDSARPAEVRNEAAEQIAIASMVILNKCDLLPCDSGDNRYALDDLEATVRTLNPNLKHVLRAVRAEIDISALLQSPEKGTVPIPAPVPVSLHDNSIKAHCLVKDAFYDEGSITKWIKDAVLHHGGLLRLKAVVPILKDPRRLLIQVVRKQLSSNWGAEWGTGDPHTAKVIFIGRNLGYDELYASFNGVPCSPSDDLHVTR